MHVRGAMAGFLAVVVSVAGAAAAFAASAPADLTGDDVCALLSAEDAGTALGVTVTEASSSTSSTPQCSYGFRTDDGVITNVVVAVQRADGDLGGRVGKKAHAYAVKLNRRYADAKTKFSKLKGVGSAATFIVGTANKNLIVLTSDGRVVTIVGNALTKASASKLGKAVVSQLS